MDSFRGGSGRAFIVRRIGSRGRSPSPNSVRRRGSCLFADTPQRGEAATKGARTSVEWRLDSGSIFTGFGAGAQAAVSVRDFAKLFPLTVQSRIGFEPPFDCPRFVPSRSIGYFVGRQDA